MGWFRRRRKPRPLVPGELIDTSTPEGRARFYEVWGSLPEVRDSPTPAPNPYGISLAEYVIEDRGPY